MNVFKSIGRALKKVSDVVPVNLLRPGPTLFADGTIPADPSYRRLPVLIWGDAFFSGDRPPSPGLMHMNVCIHGST
jgi:hypothetical protein